MEEDMPIVVLDNGGGVLKAGLSGDDYPSVVLQNAVGLHDYENLCDPDTFQTFVKSQIRYRRPVDHGQIQNWADMESLWEYVVHQKLHVDPQECALLVTEPIANPRPSRERIAEVMFEKVGFRAVSVATAPILPLYAAGRTSGIVLDVGEGTTQVAPVWGGYPITDAMKRVNFGGQHVTQLMAASVQLPRDYNSDCSSEVLRILKEKGCHVSLDGTSTSAIASPTVELPDGQNVTFPSTARLAPELLFNPSRFDDSAEDLNRVGVHTLVYNAIMKANIDVRKDLYANIVLSGGSTLFPGFKERLEQELKSMAPPSVKINVIAQPARKYFTWIGGSVLASLASFPGTLVTKQSWEEGSGRDKIGKIFS